MIEDKPGKDCRFYAGFMQVATYFSILSPEKIAQVHIPIFFAATADEQIAPKQAMWSLMKSHGNDEYNLQKQDDISDLSCNPVTTLKKILVHSLLKNSEMYRMGINHHLNFERKYFAM